MTKQELINRLSDIEWEDFEVKTAKSSVPKSVWETVSAFANTKGGWIIFGISQNNDSFEISGVKNAGFGIDKIEHNWFLYNKTKPIYDLDFDSTIVKFIVNIDNDTDGRLNLILKKIKENKTITTKELSILCNVSQITIKRDLDKLKKTKYY